MTLEIAPCSREAAVHAVMNWHYSQRMPKSRLLYFGVWERDAFIGAVILGRGANDQMLKPYNLKQSEGCELVRIALRDHEAPVSQIVAVTLRDLKRTNPGLRLVVSFADPSRGHHGGIYQAGGWVYLGLSEPSQEYLINGEQVHGRRVSLMIRAAKRFPDRAQQPGESRTAWLQRVADPNASRVTVAGKHRYVMPLDKQMRRMIVKQAQPYPPATDTRPRDRRRSTPTPGGGAGSTPADRSEANT